MLHKICGYKGCRDIVEHPFLYCPKHELEFKQDEKLRYKEYDSRRKLDAFYIKYRQFYNSGDWLRARDTCISQCLGMDIVEYYRTGRIVIGDKVHHIIPIDKEWDKRFNVDLMICLSERTHRKVHAEYDKGIKEYESMIKMLFELKKNFMKEFGIA